MIAHCIGSSSHSSHVARACVIVECCFWSFRHFHSHLLLPHHLSDHPVLPTARQLQLPRCGHTLRTSAEDLGTLCRVRPSHRLWAQRPLHHRGLCRIHPGVHRRAAVPRWLRQRWRHHRQDAPWRAPKTSRSLWRRRPVVLSVVVSQTW